MDHLADQLDRVSLLGEPLRRSLYAYVAGEPDAVSREQASTALDLPVHTAKFHLDRLVEGGLLEVEFRRVSGRRGPGAGRPSKLYRRSSRQLAVSLPERRYDLAGKVLAAAVDRSMREGSAIAGVLPEVAHEQGRHLGAADPVTAGAGRHQPLATAARVLERYGYEPVVDQQVCLVNCPFDRLAAEHTELVCAMNRDLVAGMLDGAGVPGLVTLLAPHEGFCCVRVGHPR